MKQIIAADVKYQKQNIFWQKIFETAVYYDFRINNQERLFHAIIY